MIETPSPALHKGQYKHYNRLWRKVPHASGLEYPEGPWRIKYPTLHATGTKKTLSDYHSEWTPCSLVTMQVHCTLLITKYHAKSQKSKYQLEALQNGDQTNSGE